MRVKRMYFFSDERKPLLNIVDKIEIHIFADNDKETKRLGKALIDTRCFLDHALQRI